MAQTHDILRSNASKLDTEFSNMQTAAAVRAMVDYAALKINEYRASESKAIKLEAIKLFPALLRGEWKLWLRKRAFLKAKKSAQKRADIEGRPFYVIRATDISYIVQSTLEAKVLRKRGLYAKNVNAQKLIETADCMCYPTYKSNIGHGFTAKEFSDEMKNKHFKKEKK